MANRCHLTCQRLCVVRDFLDPCFRAQEGRAPRAKPVDTERGADGPVMVLSYHPKSSRLHLRRGKSEVVTLKVSHLVSLIAVIVCNPVSTLSSQVPQDKVLCWKPSVGTTQLPWLSPAQATLCTCAGRLTMPTIGRALRFGMQVSKT